MTIAALGAAQQTPVTEGPPTPLPGTPVPIPEAKTIAWTVPLPAAPIVSPLIVNDLVIVGHLPATVAAFGLADGRQTWRVDLAPERPLVSDGTLILVAAGEAIHAIRARDGSLAWRAPVGTLTAPLLIKDGWVIAARERQLTALRAADGSAVWSVDATPLRQAPAIGGNVLFAPTAGGRLVARDLADGRVKWERQLGGEAGEPFVLGDDIFIGAADKRFYCIDASSGEIEWPMRVGAPPRGRAASDGERVVFAALDNQVYAVDRITGAIRWHKGVPYRPSTGPLVAGGAVFVAGPAAEVKILSAATGAPAASLTLPARLALPPGASETKAGVIFAAVTGSLAESWTLLLTMPSGPVLR